MSLSRTDVTVAGIHQNPVAAMGVPGTRDITHPGASAPQDAGSASASEASCDWEGSSLGDVDEARAHAASEEGRAEPRFIAPWALVEKLVRGDEELLPGVQGTCKAASLYNAEFKLRNDRFPQPARQPMAPGASFSEFWRLPPDTDALALRHDEYQWEAAVSSVVCRTGGAPVMALPVAPQLRTEDAVMQVAEAWITGGRCST